MLVENEPAGPVAEGGESSCKKRDADTTGNNSAPPEKIARFKLNDTVFDVFEDVDD